MSKKKEKEIINKIKDPNPKGICGLINLGNTCYLNSILQCLLHLPELVTYMLSQKLNEDLEYNKKINQHLTERDKIRQELIYKLINEFILILNQMWQGYSFNNNNNNEVNDKSISINSKNVLEPKNFKKILEEIYPQFEGCSQQDAHEVLTSILDSFHIGLNKSRNDGGLKICVSSINSELLLRKTLSCIADTSHKAVNDSFIEDIFFGQLSSIFSCSKCGLKLKEAYEPFCSLELSIPIEKNINLLILPLNFDKENKEQIKLEMNINDNMSYDDIYDYMNKITGYKFDNYVIYWKNNEKNRYGNNKKRRTLRSNNKNKDINDYNDILLNEDIIINDFNYDKCQYFINSKINELILFENPALQNYDEFDYYYNIHLKVINSKNNYYYNSQENIDRVFKVRLSEKEEGDDFLIFNYIYKYLENFLDNKKNKKEKIHNSFHINNNYNKINNKKNKKNNNKDINNNLNNNIIELKEDKEIIYQEKKYIFGIVCKKIIKEENDTNNINFEYPLCPLCNNKAKKVSEDHYECLCINKYLDDEFYIENKEYKKILSDQIKHLIENKTASPQNIISIIVHPYSNFSFINFNKFSMYAITTNLSKSKKKIHVQQNLLSLFDIYTANEKIEHSSNCEICGQIKYTLQKKEIHKFPQILIIHIKRFKNEYEKNEEKIEFPEEIDLTKYNNKKFEGKYELNSTVFHQGNLKSGHYTSIYKYLNTKQWLFCNDTKIKLIPENKILGINNKDNFFSIGDGYILFYRKK